MSSLGPHIPLSLAIPSTSIGDEICPPVMPLVEFNRWSEEISEFQMKLNSIIYEQNLSATHIGYGAGVAIGRVIGTREDGLNEAESEKNEEPQEDSFLVASCKGIAKLGLSYCLRKYKAWREANRRAALSPLSPSQDNPEPVPVLASAPDPIIPSISLDILPAQLPSQILDQGGSEEVDPIPDEPIAFRTRSKTEPIAFRTRSSRKKTRTRF